MLLEEINALDVMIEQAEKSLETAPEGTLKVSKDNNRVQYFHRTDVNKSNGIYIRKKIRKLQES